MDNKFYMKVVMELIKQKRIKDIFKISKSGYGMSKENSNKYKLYITSKKHKEIELELNVNDKYLGKDIISMMFSRNIYETLNKNNIYKVSYAKYNKHNSYIKVIFPSLLKDKDVTVKSILYYQINDKGNKNKDLEDLKLLSENYSSAEFGEENYQFKNHEDFMDFCSSPKSYRIIDRKLDDDLINKLNKKELKEKLIELEILNRDIEKLKIKSKNLEKEIENKGGNVDGKNI